jgi:alpha-tubulin suppressor-like RCC1 family protein
LSNVTAVAAGDSHNLALKADGTVVAWGAASNGQDYVPLAVPDGLSNVVAVAAGEGHNLALRADGTVAEWGLIFDWGWVPALAPSGLTNVKAIAAGRRHSVALKADGTVVSWGANSSGQTNVPSGLKGVVAIAAGYDQTLAIVATPPPRLDGVQYLSGQGFQATLVGEAGHRYLLQASTNLLDWMGIKSFEATNGMMILADPLATNFHYRFYRAVTP